MRNVVLLKESIPEILSGLSMAGPAAKPALPLECWETDGKAK